MNLSALTVDELLRLEGSADAAGEVFRRLRCQELFTRSQVDEIEDEALGRGLDEATPEAIDFLCGIIDGEVWREQLDEDRREWIKNDLFMLLDNGL